MNWRSGLFLETVGNKSSTPGIILVNFSKARHFFSRIRSHSLGCAIRRRMPYSKAHSAHEQNLTSIRSPTSHGGRRMSSGLLWREFIPVVLKSLCTLWMMPTNPTVGPRDVEIECLYSRRVQHWGRSLPGDILRHSVSHRACANHDEIAQVSMCDRVAALTVLI